MTMPACMGGWCRKRSECSDYHATHRVDVVERMCPKGEDRPLHVGRGSREEAIPIEPPSPGRRVRPKVCA